VSQTHDPDKKVLILGGTGRIGLSVATDLLRYTPAQVILSGRNVARGQQVMVQLQAQLASGSGVYLDQRLDFLALDLEDREALAAAIAGVALVIHCAGPFHHRDARVLQLCVQHRVHYLDVSDHRSFTQQSLQYRQAAREAEIMAVINTGIFPGISNSMVRQDIETLDQADHIHLSYVVAGSGGAGRTVMRTTFLGLLHPFTVWQGGRWQQVQPYSDAEWVEFPPPFGRARVYWFDMPEALTLAQAFPIDTVITKFGSVPDVYNQITWVLAHWLPKSWLQHPAIMEFLAWGSYTTTQLTDRFSGIGVAIRSQVSGKRQGQPGTACSTLALPDTAMAAGYGTGSIAQLILSGELIQPGVWTVEECLPTPLFQSTLAQRGVQVKQQIEAGYAEPSTLKNSSNS
jgi:saccharopine dehydrogenase-like NADP-dependent oxidoreductase